MLENYHVIELIGEGSFGKVRFGGQLRAERGGEEILPPQLSVQGLQTSAGTAVLPLHHVSAPRNDVRSLPCCMCVGH